MEPLEIRAELLKRGWTIRGLARALGVSHTAVWAVIHRKLRSPRIESALFNILTAKDSQCQQKLKSSFAKDLDGGSK